MDDLKDPDLLLRLVRQKDGVNDILRADIEHLLVVIRTSIEAIEDHDEMGARQMLMVALQKHEDP